MRRIVIGILAAFVGSALTAAPGAATPVGRDVNAKCANGKVAWRIGGRTQCLAASRFAPRPARGGVAGKTLASRLFEVDLHDEWSKSSRIPIAARLLSLSQRGPGATVAAFRDVASAFAPRARSVSAARGDLPPGYTLNPDGSVTAVKDLGDGVQLTINGRGKGHTSTEDERKASGERLQAGDKVDDRYTEQQTETTFSKNGASLKLTIVDGGAPASVDMCPNGRGEVVGEASDRTKIEATAEAPNGTTAAEGTDDRWRARFDGQVGDDARLEYFDVEYDDVLLARQSVGTLELHTHIAARVDARAARRGAAGSYTNWQGTTTATNPQGSVALSAAGRMDFAQRRASAFARIVEKALELFDRAEKIWYDASDSTCVDVRGTPEAGAKIKPRQRVVVSWSVRSKVDRTRVPGRWTVSAGPYQGAVDRKQARSEPHVPAEIAFTAASHFADNTVIGYDVLLTSRAGRGTGSWHADSQEFPYRYEILAVSFETRARGRQSVPGGFCEDSSGTRDFTGRTAKNPPKSTSKLDKVGRLISGTITAWADAEWSNDVLHGCNVSPTGATVPCTFTTPPRKPQGGHEAAVFVIDPQAPGLQISGHWLIWSGEIGFASGYTGNCGFVPHVDFAVPYADLARSYPLKNFRDGGPHTIAISGSKHFSSAGFIEQSLDYDWNVKVTFRRV
jgi:hypothetical protein